MKLNWPFPNAVGPFFFSAAPGHDEIGIPRAALGTALTPRPGRDRAGQSACRLITKAIGRVISVAATAAVAGWLPALACPIQGKLLPYQYGYPQAELAVAG